MKHDGLHSDKGKRLAGVSQHVQRTTPTLAAKTSVCGHQDPRIFAPHFQLFECAPVMGFLGNVRNVGLTAHGP